MINCSHQPPKLQNTKSRQNFGEIWNLGALVAKKQLIMVND
jgi:hypothetical protein